MINEKINKAAISLWEKTYAGNVEDKDIRMPLIYPPIKKESILFIGLNPSFSDRGFRTILADTKHVDLSPEKFYNWRNRSKFNFKTALEIEELAKTKHSYFKKFIEISNDLQLDWEHIDLFYYRDTNQNKLKEVILDRNNLNDFGRKQLRLTKDLLFEIKPKIVVVANAFASGLFENELNLNVEFDEYFGCHLTKLNGRTVPTFLASMFTGQRAMDNYSFNRLKWHIKSVYQQTRG
jgi:hypothetical protein